MDACSRGGDSARGPVLLSHTGCWGWGSGCVCPSSGLCVCLREEKSTEGSVGLCSSECWKAGGGSWDPQLGGWKAGRGFLLHPGLRAYKRWGAGRVEALLQERTTQGGFSLNPPHLRNPSSYPNEDSLLTWAGFRPAPRLRATRAGWGWGSLPGDWGRSWRLRVSLGAGGGRGKTAEVPSG